jgi:hypothetical protein
MVVDADRLDDDRGDWETWWLLSGYLAVARFFRLTLEWNHVNGTLKHVIGLSMILAIENGQ